MEQKKEAKKVCSKCGKEYVNHYDGDVSFIMEAENVCFTCAFWIWQHRVDQEGKRKYAIINGKHYVLDPHTDRNWPVGSCGRVYTIRFHNGETVVCDNLWHQGEIPEHFRDIMPDNAEFVTD